MKEQITFEIFDKVDIRVGTVISVKKNSKIEVNGKSYKKDSLLVFLKKKFEKNPDQSIVIAADEKVKYGAVISLMDLLKQNEFNKVGLLLKPE